MVELAALALRPSTFDPAGSLQAAVSIDGARTQNELARIRMQELLAEQQENAQRRGALGAFRSQGGMNNPAAVSALAGHPDLYAQTTAGMDARQQAITVRNAHDAREVAMTTQEGTPERAAAYRRALDRALAEGRINPTLHSHYAAQPPTNLFLNNITQLATPITAGMSQRELFEMIGLADPASPRVPNLAPNVAAAPPPGAGRVAIPPVAGAQPLAGVVVDNNAAGPPATAAPPAGPRSFTTPAIAPPAPPVPQQTGAPQPRPVPGQQTVRELVAAATPAQRASLALMLSKGDMNEVAKLLQQLEGTNNPPPGFERDPDRPGALRVIAGGPGEHLTGDLAGRLAPLELAMGRLPNMRREFERTWGAGDHFAFQMSGDASGAHEIPSLSGNIGNARRELRLFGEALLRVMTGAAASPQEMERVNGLMQIGPRDSIESARHKLDMLEEFAKRYRAIALAGRTANPASIAVPPPSTATTAPPAAPAAGGGGFRVLGVR